MISAPRAPSQRVAHGPARTQLKSTTRMFSSARGRDMASFSRAAVQCDMATVTRHVDAGSTIGSPSLRSV
jgi:hypothetical protein